MYHMSKYKKLYLMFLYVVPKVPGVLDNEDMYPIVQVGHPGE